MPSPVRVQALIGGAGHPGQLQAAGDVVVVHMGLRHIRDAHPTLRRCGDHLVDVARRIDDHRAAGAAGQVAAVAQALEYQGVDEEHGCGSSRRAVYLGGYPVHSA
ncbi:hypothetical protein GCM10022285_09480 [Streptomyces tunisiensis]|uniref:Uncharacterized protein n=1 Tax=Streptomyces tunisiensis TaxID=948699 RepID=A0ABP7XUS1_9ACTN